MTTGRGTGEGGRVVSGTIIGYWTRTSFAIVARSFANSASPPKPNMRSITRPRQMAMALSKELTNHSLPEIGDAFGGRDHTTVLHAVRKVGGERGKSTELNQQLHVLEQTLKG